MKQAQALAIMQQGDSVFLTGPAGSGKTYVINKFIAWAKRHHKTVAITASTGIAATHIGGVTIHSWTGLGIRDSLSERDEAWLKANDKLRKRYNSTDILVIDEVSMLHGARLDMINRACQILREDEGPFGGMQIILVGDLFQLPPVNREGGLDDFVHTSEAWEQLQPKVCYLDEQHRQEGGELLEILNAMRGGLVDEYHVELLQKSTKRIMPDGQVITKLYSHNVDVDTMNDRKLASLAGDSKTYDMHSSGSSSKVEQLTRGVLAPEKLVLKVGAEVMFVANNFSKGFANGTRGVVVDITKEGPVVKIHGSGKEIVVEMHSWTLEEDGRRRAEVAQIPLRLAWAITIHKSQGMSLDAAEIDLSRSFTPGMGYVALSRVRSMDGLYLRGINDVALRLHPDIHEFDIILRKSSKSLSLATIGDFVDNTPKDDVSDGSSEDEQQSDKLYSDLAYWRATTAAALKKPAYTIAHNTTLRQIAVRKPQNHTQLFAISGVGQKFIDNYGNDVIRLVSLA